MKAAEGLRDGSPATAHRHNKNTIHLIQETTPWPYFP